MGEQRQKPHISAGLLAHVDAGKTTLSEALLYETGQLRQLGRVDHRDSFLDTHSLERTRGITIFSKQARLSTESLAVTLLDTPGHMDFSAEMERTLQVLDYAVLVISGTDGVQAHTETLWRLLRQYGIPTFLFVNKMDLAGADRVRLRRELEEKLSEYCVDFSRPRAEIFEQAALCGEAVLEEYLKTGEISRTVLAGLVREEKLFPCFYGSALRLQGIGELVRGLEELTVEPRYPEAFSARVYQIGRDRQGARLTYLKVTGGTLRVREQLSYEDPEGRCLAEKVKELRLYSGTEYQQTDAVPAGQVCAVLGLSATYPGQGLGGAAPAKGPLLEPVMNYRLRLPEGCDPMLMLPKLRQLQEEDPMLQVTWEERLREIHLRLMGQVQTEVLKSLVKERFGTEVQVDSGQVLYKETIAEPVEGVGHFEPLRHYAEVHLLLEPLPPGSGLRFGTRCSEDVLDRSWQRLILTHLKEKAHLGVLTGSPVTDLRITLMSGRAHLKHTEGGDFRQATYRAVRQGLMGARNVLLEPFYNVILTVPGSQVGRAMGDLRTMGGELSQPKPQGDMMELRAKVPVAALGDYGLQVTAYTQGRGRLACEPGGYAPCRDQDRIVESLGYDPEADLANTPDSVFCAHGAGFTVKWRDVPDYMHLESCLKPESREEPRLRSRNLNLDDRELEAIMEREFGPIRRKQYGPSRQAGGGILDKPFVPRKEYLIVDGYNIIFAWDELKELAREDLSQARRQLMELLAAYASFKRREVVLVFDGYKVKGNPGERFRFHGLYVVYTKENETGDMFLESMAAGIGKNDRVYVATSDSLVQLSALRSGVLRMSARELREEVESAQGEIRLLLEELNRREDRKMEKRTK